MQTFLFPSYVVLIGCFAGQDYQFIQTCNGSTEKMGWLTLQEMSFTNNLKKTRIDTTHS